MQSPQRGSVHERPGKACLGAIQSVFAQRLDGLEIILFGSRARGDADAFSDMDVILILEGDADDPSRDIVSECAWEAGFESDTVVVPIAFSRTASDPYPYLGSLDTVESGGCGPCSDISR